MKVMNLITTSSDSLLYNPKFRRVIEQHLLWIRRQPTTTSEIVDPDQAYRFRGDLFGYLRVMGVTPEKAWVIMRVNEWNHPTEFTEDTRFILIPDDAVIAQIRSGYLTAQKKLN